MSEKLNIAGLGKAELLAALHNGTRAIGLGVLHDIRRNMTPAEAQEIIDARGGDLDFDYVCGRPVKSIIDGDEFDPWLYDRDAGQGKAARIIAVMREGGGVCERVAAPTVSDGNDIDW